MATEQREKVLDKLRKLHAKYQSIKECSTEEEAQAFAAKIQELLSTHKLDMSVLEYEKRDETDPIKQVEVDWSSIGFEVKQKRVAWHEDLARFVCQFNFCRYVVDASHRVKREGFGSWNHRGSSRLWFVGRTSDVEPTVLTFLYLAQMADKIADKEYVKYFYECKREGHVEKARGFRGSFLEGFCQRLGERYAEERERIKRLHASQSTALVRLTNSLTEVKKWMDESKKFTAVKTQAPVTRGNNDEGRRRGRSAAENIPVGRQEKMIK